MDVDSEHDSKVSQLIAMGYEATKADNALKAAGGDLEAAVEVLLADDYVEVSNPGSTSRAAPGAAAPTGEKMTDIEGKTAKEVLDMWGKKMLGEDKHNQVRSHVKTGVAATKNAWQKTVEKAKELDEQNKLSVKAKEAFSKCDEKMRSFDEQHQWSAKTQDVAAKAARGLNKGVETAKRSLTPTPGASPVETRQDATMGGTMS